MWIKTVDKKILRLTDTYQPFFYIIPRKEQDGQYLFHILSQQSAINKVSWEENKFTNLFKDGGRSKLICVVPESVQHYVSLLKKLEKDYRVKQFYVQQYLFYRLKVEPTSIVDVEYDGSKLVELTKVEDKDEISPPPFSLLYVDVQTTSGKINPEDPVFIIKSRYEDASDPQQDSGIMFENNQEKDILVDFYNDVQAKDPDIIVFLGDHYANTILDYLFARIVIFGLDLYLGREKKNVESLTVFKHPGGHWIKGRLSVGSKTPNRY